MATVHEIDTGFQQLLTKYSHFLSKPTNTEQLLELGKKLFDDNSNEEIERPSYSLLKKKEQELNIVEAKSEVKVKALHHKERVSKVEPTQTSTPNELINEEIMFMQDRNSLSLARRKKLEDQRNKMLENYGQLMEQSVQRKVQLKLDMQKLKDELNDQLSKSRAEAKNAQPTKVEDNRSIMDELKDLNSQVLMKISSFKMALSNGNAEGDRAVLDRYKPHMEQILGDIYAYSEYLPVTEVISKFNSHADDIDHKTRELTSALLTEHERNYQLQKEATQLGDEVKEHEIEVSRLKQRNAQLQREISLLKEVAEREIEAMKNNLQSLLKEEYDDVMAPPLSSRSTLTCVDKSAYPIERENSNESVKPKKGKRKRSHSRKEVISRERASPNVPPVKVFVDMMKARLLDKINHEQN